MLFDSINSLVKTYSPQKQYLLSGEMKTLSELLGYSSSDRLLIVNLDDIGLCPSTNETIIELQPILNKLSISLLAGAAGFDHAIDLIKQNQFSVGVHLALTTEWEAGGIRPILPPDKIPSLLNSQGGLLNEIRDLYGQADVDQVEAECRAQIERVIAGGVRLDHIDTHMGAMQLRPDLVEIYLRLALEYNLPIRLGSQRLASLMNLPPQQISSACQQNIVFPDNLIYIPMSFASDKSTRFRAYDFTVKNIHSGITEIYFHPTKDGPDYRSLKHAYSARKAMEYEAIRRWDFEYLSSGRLNKILQDENIILVDYSELSELQKRMPRP